MSNSLVHTIFIWFFIGNHTERATDWRLNLVSILIYGDFFFNLFFLLMLTTFFFHTSFALSNYIKITSIFSAIEIYGKKWVGFLRQGWAHISFSKWHRLRRKIWLKTIHTNHQTTRKKWQKKHHPNVSLLTNRLSRNLQRILEIHIINTHKARSPGFFL